MGKNSNVHYTEKHYAEGDGKGDKIFNPQTIVYLEEGASIQMDTTQIRGVDSTKRDTKIYGKAAARWWSPSASDPRRPDGRKRHGDRFWMARTPGPGDLPRPWPRTPPTRW